MKKDGKKRNTADLPKSAADLMALLNRDPEFVARQAQQAEDIRTNNDIYRVAAQDVLTELAAAGFCVESIGSLRQLYTPYPEAVPILVRWLPRVMDSAVKEDIVRTLSVPWAADALLPLLAEFERVADDAAGTGIRWAIGNAIEVLARAEVTDEMIRLATNRRYGKAREMIVLGLGSLQSPEVRDVLFDLLDDDDVVGHAVMALGKLRPRGLRPKLEALRGHPKPWVRDEVEKALANIG